MPGGRRPGIYRAGQLWAAHRGLRAVFRAAKRAKPKPEPLALPNVLGPAFVIIIYVLLARRWLALRMPHTIEQPDV